MLSVNTVSASTSTTSDDPSYAPMLSAVRDTFEASTSAAQPLFTTDAAGLSSLFLRSLPLHVRQEHTCRACAKFIDTYGGLVTISATGHTTSAMWDAPSIDGIYHDAFKALQHVVGRAKITGVFLSSDKVWGTPKTGQWQHLAVTPPKAMVYTGVLKTAGSV